MTNRRRGVTLFETIMVLAVLVVSAGLAIPTLKTLAGSTPIDAAADAVKSAWAQARARAVAEGRPYRFAVQENTGKFRVAPDGSDLWDGSSGSSPTPSASGDNTGPALVLNGKLPGNIRFHSASADPGTASQPGAAQPAAPTQGGDWTSPIVFQPDGTTQQDATISFGEAQGRPLVLQVQSATGAATTSR